MNFIPTPTPVPTPTVYPKGKCGTCAYRAAHKTEDIEMGIGYYVEHPHAHPCHERRGVFCHGSNEFTLALEAAVTERLHNLVPPRLSEPERVVGRLHKNYYRT